MRKKFYFCSRKAIMVMMNTKDIVIQEGEKRHSNTQHYV